MNGIARLTRPPPPARRRSRRWIHAAVAITVLACAQSASAGSCSVSSSGLAFGAYQPLTFPGKLTSSDALSTATITISCSGITQGGSYTLALGPTTAGGSSINPRRMANSNGGDPMLFNVYTEATRTTIWGDVSGGSLLTGNIAVNAGSQTLTHTAYGKIPGGQHTLKAGSYSATVTMTLTYNP